MNQPINHLISRATKQQLSKQATSQSINQQIRRATKQQANTQTSQTNEQASK
jgi:hypothetical protein